MRIGIDIRNIGKKRTGDEVVFFNITKNLALIDDKNDYFLFTDIEDNNTLEIVKKDLGILRKNNFRIIPLKTKNKFTWNFQTLPAHMRKDPLDIYLTQYITPFFFPKKTKVVTIVHDVSFKVYKKFIKKSDLFFLNALIPRSLRSAAKVIAVSRFTRDEIIRYYKMKPQKVEWIHNAIGDNFLSHGITEEEKETVRKKYYLPEKFILYVGTLQPRKNLPALVRAYAEIKKDYPGFKLVLGGGKGHNYDARVDELIKELDLGKSVIFPGYIEEKDKPALMAAASLFCFPSFYEGFGIPILESMAAGTPVVASDIPPHREIAGQAALFFSPDDYKDLAEKIKSVLSDEGQAEKLSALGKKQLGKFSWKKTAEKMLDIFGSIQKS